MKKQLLILPFVIFSLGAMSKNERVKKEYDDLLKRMSKAAQPMIQIASRMKTLEESEKKEKNEKSRQIEKQKENLN